jgi:hypothetical protein
MNNDDSQRMNMQNPGMRKPMAGKYPSKTPNYSPSTSFNYSPQSGYNGNGPTQPRRRVDRFRRETLNTSERTLRQNDIIIRLLKEIRDRLPEPPNMERKNTVGALEEMGETWEREENAQDMAMEKTDETVGPEVKNEKPVDLSEGPDVKDNGPADLIGEQG